MDYLPRGEGNTKSYGSIEVTVKQIVKKADYTLTTLNIADSKVIIDWWFCCFVFILFGLILFTSFDVHVTRLVMCHTERFGIS